MMVYRHYICKVPFNSWMAFDELENSLGTYDTRRDALERVKARFDELGDDYILNFDRNLGI